MADAGDVQEPEKELQEVIAYVRDVDWFLADLIRIFAQNGIEFPLVVMVGGTIVSGYLVGGKQYFETAAKTIADGDTNNPEVRDLLVRMVEGNKRIYEKPEGVEDYQTPEPGYLHLKNAKVFVNGQRPLPANHGILWRSKLSSIDGFSFGELRSE